MRETEKAENQNAKAGSRIALLGDKFSDHVANTQSHM